MVVVGGGVGNRGDCCSGAAEYVTAIDICGGLGHGVGCGEGCCIHRNELRSYGSKLIGKRSPECPEHSPNLGAQLPRNKFCYPGESAWESEGVQLSAV